MNFNQFRKGAKIPTIALLTMLGISPLPQVWLAPTAAYAQQSIVKGTIIDEFGEPVPGASVVVAGTTTGTITDFDGNFSLNVKPGAELRISFVGYETQTVKAKDGMTIKLSENSELLGEVEVVAYGVQKKVTMTGAVASVKSEDLVRTSVGSVNNVLGGQLSGVTTVQYSGEPGSDAADIFVSTPMKSSRSLSSRMPLQQPYSVCVAPTVSCSSQHAVDRKARPRSVFPPRSRHLAPPRWLNRLQLWIMLCSTIR